MKLISVILTVMIFGMVNLAFAQKAGGPWEIPAKYKSMKSTIKANDVSINTTGKELYNKNCKSCHGAKGLGDGPKAASMKTEIRPFNSKTFVSQTDGEIYYQSFVGRNEMPNYEKKILDEGDRWSLVYFVRTLNK